MKRRAHLLTAAVAALSIAFLLPSCGYARFYVGQDDWFQSFDNETTRSDKEKRDWPVAFIFYGAKARVDASGSVRGVKGKLRDYGYGDDGGTMYLALLDAHDGDGRGIHSDADDGQKGHYTYGGCGGQSVFGTTGKHMRVYADSTDDRMTNTKYGNYVMGTVHFDIEEGSDCQRFGLSEQAENEFGTAFSNGGYSVCGDCLQMYNSENFTLLDGSQHISNGYATLVSMP